MSECDKCKLRVAEAIFIARMAESAGMKAVEVGCVADEAIQDAGLFVDAAREWSLFPEGEE